MNEMELQAFYLIKETSNKTGNKNNMIKGAIKTKRQKLKHNNIIIEINSDILNT